MMRRLYAAFALAAMMITSPGRAEAGLIVDATASKNGTTNSIFGTLDLSTGQFTEVSALSVTIQGLTTGGNGTIFGATNGGSLYTISGGVASQYGSISGPNFFGLAYAGSAGFYAADVNTEHLDQIAPDGNSFSTVGTLPPVAGSGSLSMAFGPNGSLYYTGTDLSGRLALFVVNTATGVTTEIGSGLGTVGNVPVTLVDAGGQLYGIDTATSSGTGPIDIYTINTSTGVATATGVTVTGLAAGLTLDTATGLVPEPSSLVLCGIAGVVGLVMTRARRALSA